MLTITDTFVLVAADCPATVAEVPAARGGSPTVAVVQYELLATAPYSLTLEDLIFETHLRRTGEPRTAAGRAALFAKSHPCMRASPLPKRYGWGVHHDAAGRIALFAVESKEYRELAGGAGGAAVVPAMRNKRAG